MIKQLDRQQAVRNNTKVIYLKYAKAADLVEVLTGISSTLQSDKQNAKPVAALDKNIIIKAHGQTNALIVTAAPDVMNDLERVIAQLDIRRPQVLVEAIIAEVRTPTASISASSGPTKCRDDPVQQQRSADVDGDCRRQSIQQRRHGHHFACQRVKLV